jgi:hypothetical protein
MARSAATGTWQPIPKGIANREVTSRSKSRAKAVGRLPEGRVEHRGKDLEQGLLNQSVERRGIPSMRVSLAVRLEISTRRTVTAAPSPGMLPFDLNCERAIRSTMVVKAFTAVEAILASNFFRVIHNSGALGDSREGRGTLGRGESIRKKRAQSISGPGGKERDGCSLIARATGRTLPSLPYCCTSLATCPLPRRLNSRGDILST